MQKIILKNGVFFLVQFLCFYGIGKSTSFMERVYMPFVFKPLNALLATITKPFPFSVGLLFWYLAIGFMIIFFAKKFVKKHPNRWTYLLSTINVVFCIYMLTWGLLYSRPSLPDLLGIETAPIQTHELDSLCKELVKATNATREALANKNLEDTDYEAIFKQAEQAYKSKSEAQFFFTLPNPNLKKASGSTLLSYLNTGGIYNFMTAEANVNTNNLSFEVPFTAYHELAHQAGFASEDEANYIAYLTCKSHPDPLFKYAANYAIVFRATNLLALRDSTAAKEYLGQLNPLVQQDRKQEYARWLQYQNGFQKYISGPFYDLFLKSNGEIDGESSYDKVIDLILAEKRK